MNCDITPRGYSSETLPLTVYQNRKLAAFLKLLNVTFHQKRQIKKLS